MADRSAEHPPRRHAAPAVAGLRRGRGAARAGAGPRSGTYTAFGAAQRFQDIKLPADRGSIFDRNGNDLAVSIPQRTVWADPRLVEDPKGAAAALARLLSLDPERTVALARDPRGDEGVHLVQRRVADDVADAVEAAELAGSPRSRSPKRFTPAGDLARSVLGQVGVDNEGLSGLELQYDDLLTGAPGRPQRGAGPRRPHHRRR